jgi:hypothetical protein
MKPSKDRNQAIAPKINGPAIPTVTSRRRFQDQFNADVYAVWEEHGVTALERCALEEPDKFVSVCARLVPQDVSVRVQAQPPAGLNADDWQLLREILGWSPA